MALRHYVSTASLVVLGVGAWTPAGLRVAFSYRLARGRQNQFEEDLAEPAGLGRVEQDADPCRVRAARKGQLGHEERDREIDGAQPRDRTDIPPGGAARANGGIPATPR